jgi:two-component system sensor kinase FixL
MFPWKRNRGSAVSSESQARALLQLISEGFVLVDGDFRVTDMNAEGERIEGRPRGEIIGTILWDSWPDLKDGPLGELWIRAMREQVPVSLEHHYAWPDGRSAWLEMRAYPTGDGLAIFYRDITDRKSSQEELKRAQAELIHASRLSAMGTMAATLAHELAQPLMSTSAYLDGATRMLRGLPAAEVRELRQTIGLAGASVRRASDILSRLRAFVSRGHAELETHDLQAIIADAGVLVLPHAQREGVELRFRLDRHARWVKADAVQIQQVLINLIRNAIEAMAASSDKNITISTRLLPSGSIEVAVEDTGPGLPQAKVQDVFAPFNSTKNEGLGVGLSISRTIVEAHGGTIEAEQPAAGGARFRFTLPRSREAA